VNKEDIICELENDIICEPLDEFIEAMREDADATNDEIIASVLKELKHKL
tara:strand:+ start:244 stop:393 length:150 start_codon:yes stop_codon:yes gene_type:complete